MKRTPGPLAVWRAQQDVPATKPTVDSYCSGPDDEDLELTDDSNVSVLQEEFEEPEDLDFGAEHDDSYRLQVDYLNDRALLTMPNGFLQHANRFGLYFILDEKRRFITYDEIRNKGTQGTYASMLTYMGVRFGVEDGRISIDFSSLSQSGLHYWVNRKKHVPVYGSVLVVAKSNQGWLMAAPNN